MIKMRATLQDGGQLILLGLSDKNLELLREKKPILVTAQELGLAMNVKIALAWGETEETLMAEIKEAFGEVERQHEG